MGNKDPETMARIRAATAELLEEQGSAEGITVRQIAQRAGVGTGLINYHFGSKNQLVGEVIGEKMQKLAEEYLYRQNDGLPPKERLTATLKALFSFGAEYKPLMQTLIRQGFENGNTVALLIITPLLKEVLGTEADEMRLRVLATQILYPIQVVCLAPEKFKVFSGIDIEKPAERDAFVEQLINNLV